VLYASPLTFLRQILVVLTVVGFSSALNSFGVYQNSGPPVRFNPMQRCRGLFTTKARQTACPSVVLVALPRLTRTAEGSSLHGLITPCFSNYLAHASLKLLLGMLAKEFFADHASFIGQSDFHLWWVIGFMANSHRASLVQPE
jgi:hypothetical protein